MARYTTHLRTPRSPAETFDYLADLRNFAAWDPGIRHSEQVEGEGPGVGSEYLLTVPYPTGSLELRYEIVEFEPPTRVLVRADTSRLSSVDEILVRPDGEGGSYVTYDADIRLKGALRIAQPVLALAFRRIGDRAAEGMREALDGIEVSA